MVQQAAACLSAVHELGVLRTLGISKGNCVRRMHAGSVVEEGLQWDIKVNSSDDIRAQRVNKSLAALLVLRSASTELFLILI